MTLITWNTHATTGDVRSACGLFGVYALPEGFIAIAWHGGDLDFSDAYPTLAEAQAWCERQLQPAEVALVAKHQGEGK